MVTKSWIKQIVFTKKYMPFIIKKLNFSPIILVTLLLYSITTFAIGFNKDISGWDILNKSTRYSYEYKIPPNASSTQLLVTVYIYLNDTIIQELTIPPNSTFILHPMQRARIIVAESEIPHWLSTNLSATSDAGNINTIDLSSSSSSDQATATDELVHHQNATTSTEENFASEKATIPNPQAETTIYTVEEYARVTPTELDRLATNAESQLWPLRIERENLEKRIEKLKSTLLRINSKRAERYKTTEEQYKICKTIIHDLTQQEADLTAQLAEVTQEPTLPQCFARCLGTLPDEFKSLLEQTSREFEQLCSKETEAAVDKKTLSSSSKTVMFKFLDEYCHSCDQLLEKYITEINSLCSRKNRDRTIANQQRIINLERKLTTIRSQLREERNRQMTLRLALPEHTNSTTEEATARESTQNYYTKWWLVLTKLWQNLHQGKPS